MDYIVLDLEWNQAAYKVDEEDEIPFEIIEIGAVKLNKHAEKVDEFSRLIRPQVYPFLLRRTKELTGITDDDLDTQGIYFEDAIEEFLKWCGKDYIFCIWGPTDLTQLERNMAYYKIKLPWKYPFKYLDVQKMYALQMQEGKQRHTLEYVIEQFNIPTDRPFHRAIDDAAYTAMVLQRLDRAKYEQFFSIDYYKVPRNLFEEKTFYFPTYSKYVSRRFAMKEELIRNRKVCETPCFYCKKQLKKVIPWFSDGGRNYLALAECKEHGKMRCRIRVKTTEDYTGVFAVRTVRACNEGDAEAIISKKESQRQKRRDKRKRDAEKARTAKRAGEEDK